MHIFNPHVVTGAVHTSATAYAIRTIIHDPQVRGCSEITRHAQAVTRDVAKSCAI